MQVQDIGFVLKALFQVDVYRTVVEAVERVLGVPVLRTVVDNIPDQGIYLRIVFRNA